MSIISFFFIILIPRPPRYTLFPYTTLFRSHTFSMINENNERVWVKFHIRTQQGIENLTNEEAREIIGRDRKSTRLNSSHVAISYAVFCLKKKNIKRRSPSERRLLLVTMRTE